MLRLENVLNSLKRCLVTNGKGCQIGWRMLLVAKDYIIYRLLFLNIKIKQNNLYTK